MARLSGVFSRTLPSTNGCEPNSAAGKIPGTAVEARTASGPKASVMSWFQKTRSSPVAQLVAAIFSHTFELRMAR